MKETEKTKNPDFRDEFLIVIWKSKEGARSGRWRRRGSGTQGAMRSSQSEHKTISPRFKFS
jgi:hypothetical protein